MKKSLAFKNLELLNIAVMFVVGLVLMVLFADESFVIVMLFVGGTGFYLLLFSVVLWQELKDRKEISKTATIFKNFTILLGVAIFLMTAVYVVGIFCDILTIVDLFEHIIPSFMIVHSLITLVWILVRCYNYDKQGIIIVNSKHYLTLINPKTQKLTYQNNTFSLHDLSEIEVYYKSKQILKSNIAVSLKSGTLFLRGQNIQPLDNKKMTEADDFSIILKTTDVYHATMLIHASYENCLKIAETAFLIRKNALKIGQ